MAILEYNHYCPYSIAHREVPWPHETENCPMTNHLCRCSQYLNVVFHAVMVTLLYLCGDVEKNPGPLCELRSV